jgi:hypothetical protein
MWHHVNPNSGSKGKRERRRGLNENDHLPHGKTEEQIRGGLPRRGDAHRHLRERRWPGGRGETKRETRGVYSPSQLRRRRCREVPPRRWDESSDSDTGGGAVEYVRGRELDGEVKYERGRARWSTREGGIGGCREPGVWGVSTGHEATATGREARTTDPHRRW